jgi:succinate dehydrogenase/fumarate reductase flavoprotein subunit
VADLVVAGAGMAGLVAAARAGELGAEVVVHEKLDRAGGSMLLSSGVVWRHRDFDRFGADCPDGDESLQRLVFERLDAGLAWLESLGAPVVERGTGNPLTAGVRFDPRGLTEVLLRAAGEVRLGDPLVLLPDATPVVLATGGFPASRELVRQHVTAQSEHLLLRASPGNTGDGLRLGLTAGARTSGGLDEAYGRNLPAPPARVEEADFVRLAQLYARHAEITNERGERYEPRTWSEIDVFQWTARQPRARAWFRVPDAALSERIRALTVGEMVEAAAAAGAAVRHDGDAVTVETVAGITSTLGGMAIDRRARAAPGVFAAGDDAGGIATGGYASGLAAALVFGRIAAESALELRNR